MATLSDIAGQANVSVSTVSKVLNNNTEISTETSKRVLKVARRLGYSFEESKVLGASTRTIGVIAPEAISSYYSVLAHEIQAILSLNHYQTIVGFSNFIPEKEEKLLELFAEKNVDGVILIHTPSEYTAQALRVFKKKEDVIVTQILLQNIDLPVNAEYDSYIVDEEHGILRALEYIIELGHKNIAFIGEKVGEMRIKCYLNCMKKLNLNMTNNNVYTGLERFEYGGYLRMKEVLKSVSLPTAVFAGYDDLAIGAMRAIKEAGKRIPEDISIIGFDDNKVAAYLNPSLTTVGVPFKKFAQVSTDSILTRLKTGDSSNILHGTILPDLFIRESCGPAG